jgi:hypothetical protein
MKEHHFLKVISPGKKQESPINDHLDSLLRFKGVVLNLTENALECLNRISQREAQKDPSLPILMEKYFLLHHYLDFIKRLCGGKSV